MKRPEVSCGIMSLLMKVRGSAKGKAASTKFTRISTNGTQSIVLCEPITGRTHQVRKMLVVLDWLFLAIQKFGCIFEYDFYFYIFFSFDEENAFDLNSMLLIYLIFGLNIAILCKPHSLQKKYSIISIFNVLFFEAEI